MRTSIYQLPQEYDPLIWIRFSTPVLLFCLKKSFVVFWTKLVYLFRFIYSSLSKHIQKKRVEEPLSIACRWTSQKENKNNDLKNIRMDKTPAVVADWSMTPISQIQVEKTVPWPWFEFRLGLFTCHFQKLKSWTLIWCYLWFTQVVKDIKEKLYDEWMNEWIVITWLDCLCTYCSIHRSERHFQIHSAVIASHDGSLQNGIG